MATELVSSPILRVGIVGTGAMGTNHLRVARSLPGILVTAATDRDPAQLRAALQAHAAPAVNHYQEMLSQVDAVMVSTPTESHFEIARYFISHGRHVLVEKPMTRTLAEADELVRLASETGVVVGVGHLERFNPAVQWVRPFVNNPLFIESQRLGSFSPRSLDIDVVMDLMIHDLDIILDMDSSAVEGISALGVPIISSCVDIANVRLEFASGLVANLTASRVSQKKTRKLRIFQKDQYISLDYKKRTVKSYSLRDGNIHEEIPNIPDQEPLANLWARFRDSIHRNGKGNVGPAQARRALDLALRISRNIEEKASNRITG
ncbi:MAG TPA: Gfo/Idh/MocA family oxidoreductase [Candidatus Aminicenantes bacterium]|nr:Gfo/Idh/MocA family oxidoreductase [Candidatus Aminicenantes bacterium]